MSEARIYTENGVNYSFPPYGEYDDTRPIGYDYDVPFTWKNNKTGKEGQSVVSLRDPNDIHRLISHWNRTREWTYGAMPYSGIVS